MRNLRIRLGLVVLGMAVIAAGPAPASADGPTTIRVSLSSTGAQPNQQAWMPKISANGRYVTYESYATNLVPDDTNGSADIFLWDRITQTTTRVSVASTGVQSNSYSTSPTISANGRYIAFSSGATNLVPGDTNNTSDIYLRDRGPRGVPQPTTASTGSSAPPRGQGAPRG